MAKFPNKALRTTTAEPFGPFIKARRREYLQGTQEDLAKICGVSREAVTQWETGVFMPRIETFPVLAQALGVSIGELIRRHPVYHRLHSMAENG